MTLEPGARLGPYEIQALLGAGGMGEVYRARDSRLGRTVAIKVLPQQLLDSPARRQRFEREARTASRLSHPQICAIYDVGTHDGIHFIVMEHLEGQTLAERLRGGALPVNQVLRHAIEIADALCHAHRAGIIHRDLKPANVMLTPAGAKLLDFGVARLAAFDGSESAVLAQHTTETEALTEVGTIVGTVNYMAPEQLEGKEADARTDIFAFGTILYEMATGQRAFDGTSKASVIAAILHHDPPPLSSAADSRGPGASREAPMLATLDRAASRCLAKDPDERWQTAADLRQELKWIAEGHAPVAAVNRRVAPHRWFRSGLVWLAAVCVAGMAGVSLAVGSGWMARPSPQPTFKQLTFRQGIVTEARFAADSQTILYSAAWDGGPVRLYQTRARGPASRSLDRPSTGLASVSSGDELALLRDCRLEYGFCVGTLAHMPLAGGAARELLEDVAGADWTPDGRQLAAIRVTGGEYRLEFPAGERTLHRSSGRLSSLRFAPEGRQGRRLAFMEFPVLGGEVGALKVVDLEGRITTLVTGWQTIRGLQWSPDGGEIWFTGSRTGKSCSLYAVSLSGEVRLLFHAPGDVTLVDVARDRRVLLTYGPARGRLVWSSDGVERELSWFDWSTVADLSSDGRTVLFHEGGEGAGASPGVYSRPVDGSDAVRLGDGKALALSPDGRWALALIEKDRPEMVLHPTGTGGIRVLPTEGVKDVYWARWFADSRRILLVAWLEEGVQTFIQDIETGGRQRVGAVGTMGLLVHPDSRRMLARDALGNFHLWPFDGGEPAPVSGLRLEDTPFQWSSDPRFIFLRSDEGDVIRIYRHNLATGRRALWKTLAPRDPAGVIGVATGRGELAMTQDGKSVVFTYWSWLGDLFLVEGVR